MPASGKTSLGRRVAERFSLPYLSKDGIKERLFDALGWGDRAWSKRLGGATYDLLFHVLEALLAAGRSCIVEANFYPEFHTERFAELGRSYRFEAFQIHCVAEGAVLLDRFRERWERGERHPGHLDDVTLVELRERVAQGGTGPLPLEGRLWEVDTTELERFDDLELFAAIEVALGGEPG